MMPADMLPEWIQNVAAWNPLTWAVEIGRDALAGSLDWAVAVGLAGAAARPRGARVLVGGGQHPGVSALDVVPPSGPV